MPLQNFTILYLFTDLRHPLQAVTSPSNQAMQLAIMTMLATCQTALQDSCHLRHKQRAVLPTRQGTGRERNADYSAT